MESPITLYMASTIHVAIRKLIIYTTSVWKCMFITAVLTGSLISQYMASTFHVAFHRVICYTTSVW